MPTAWEARSLVHGAQRSLGGGQEDLMGGGGRWGLTCPGAQVCPEDGGPESGGQGSIVERTGQGGSLGSSEP